MVARQYSVCSKRCTPHSVSNFALIGLNRGDGNITNTLEAALAAKSRVSEYLWAIELGNEPDCEFGLLRLERLDSDFS